MALKTEIIWLPRTLSVGETHPGWSESDYNWTWFVFVDMVISFPFASHSGQSAQVSVNSSTHSYTVCTGHYIADVYDVTSSRWLTCDDTSVAVISEDSVRRLRGSTGYIFFYQAKYVSLPSTSIDAFIAADRQSLHLPLESLTRRRFSHSFNFLWISAFLCHQFFLFLEHFYRQRSEFFSVK